MANNSILRNDPLTVSIDSTVTLDRPMLLSNHEQNLPTDNEFTNPSESDIGDLPPNYFDISIVPNGAILYNNDVTQFTEASKAEIERNSTGVVSFDPLIDRNPDQLWLYFMTYLNEKPQLKIHIRGYYTKGGSEFKCSIDLSSYICEHWWRIAVIPSAKAIKNGEIVTLRDCLEQYTLSRKKIKLIIMKKQLYGWNLVELQQQLIRLVRSTGYQNNISVSYDKLNPTITARSSSALSRFVNSSVVLFLCCISCLCIIFGPIICCLRVIGSTRDKIVADYMMMEPTDTFLQLNSVTIINTVIQRSFKSYKAHYD